MDKLMIEDLEGKVQNPRKIIINLWMKNSMIIQDFFKELCQGWWRSVNILTFHINL